MLAPEKIIYLDNNATTQVDPAVLEEMLPFLAKYFGNPSSGYRFGAQVRDAIDLARERVAALLGCAPTEVVFTSGGTEANRSAIHSALQLDPARQHIVTTAVEHSAVRDLCRQLAQGGCEVTFVGVDEYGNLDLDELRDAIRPETALASVMWANNETGVLFPIAEAAAIAREKRVLFHSDAVQAVGKIPIRVSDLSVNFLSASAHKLHGPKGVGALYVSARSAFRPLFLGGGQENKRRAGTENVASIAGFGKAAELAASALTNEQSQVRALRDRFETTLLAQVPDTSVNGNPTQRLPNTSSISFAGIDAGSALLLLDQQKTCCSAGSACHTGSREPSHVLSAMGLPEERLRASLRFSLSRFSTDDEVDRALALIPPAIAKLRAMSPNQTVVVAR
ncbi:MAG: cysteine desulfurase NifS [Chthoniobacterales bacterium]